MSAAAFRDRLDRLGLSQSALAREMARQGDPRPVPTILRSISNWARAEYAVPGEMWVVLTLMEHLMEADGTARRAG